MWGLRPPRFASLPLLASLRERVEDNARRRGACRFVPALLALALLSACACGGSIAASPSALVAKDEPRRPPGVFVAPKSELPRVEASTKNRGRVALREPLERGAIEAVLGRFFHALETEDSDGLADVFTHDAISLEGGNWFPGMMNGGVSPVVMLWRSRLEQRGLGALRGLTYAQFDAMERETQEDVHARDRTRAGVMRAGDELVHVPIVAPRGAEGILGSGFVFLVRRTPEGVRIAGLAEEGAP